MPHEFVWKPTPDFASKTNIARLMAKRGIGSYEELLRWSREDIREFWEAVVRDLGIEWFKPYHSVLDDSRGIPWGKWFVGGRINIAHNCIDRHASSWRRNKLALIWEGEDGSTRKFSYRELYGEVNRAANGLLKLGVRKGDIVAIFMPLVPEAVIISFACGKIGAIFTPIFSGYGAQAVASRLNDSGAKVIVTVDGFLRRGRVVEIKHVADEARNSAQSVERTIVCRRANVDVPWDSTRDVDWSDFVFEESLYCPTEQTDSEDPFMLIYTSGTTGKPKGAVHVHGGFLVKIAEEIAYQLDLKDEDILFWVTDMGWIMAPWELVGALCLGGTVFIYDGAIDYPEPDRLWSMVERHGISILGISPTAIRVLMRYGDQWVKKYDLRSLRILGSTGEPWNPEPYLWYFEKVGKGRCPIINISGGTEVGACFLSPHPIMPLKVCSLGGPALGMDLDVFDEKGRSLRGTMGELVCKSPWPGMTRGVWKQPERYLEAYWSRWPDVWAHGDWAMVDGDGQWFLFGRSDDTIKIAGKRVGPAELESVLVSHPAVSEAAAIGVPHELKGEAILCFVVLKPGWESSQALREELKQFVANQMGKPLAPEDVKFVSQLVKTRNAKIMRRVIRARYLHQDLGDLSSIENLEAIEQIDRAK